MTEVFGPFEDVTIEQILESWHNGQKHQMAVMINYYGTEFWYDFASWLLANSDDYITESNLFTLITVNYNAWFPHPNQQDMK